MKKKGNREGGEKGDCGMMGWGKAKEKSGGCVCVHMCLLALPEKKADSEGLLSLQVLAIGHRNHSEISLLLLLTNGLRSLIWLAQDQKQMAYSLRGSVAAPGGWRGAAVDYGLVSLSLWQRCLCVCTSVLEAAVFADAFPLPPPREAACVCMSEKEKCMLWFEQC